MFKDVKKETKKVDEKLHKWKKEEMIALRKYSRKRLMMIVPVLNATNHSIEASFDVYPISEEQAVSSFPEIEYKEGEVKK